MVEESKEFSQLDFGGVLRSAHEDKNKTLQITSANTSVPARYFKVTLTYNRSDSVTNVKFYEGSLAEIRHVEFVDNIGGMSYILELSHCKDVWQEIKRQKFRYDNVNPKNPERYIHLRDLVFYRVCAKSNLCTLLLPILTIACIVFCMRKREETSGKILAWVKMEILFHFWIMQVCKWVCDKLIAKKHGDWVDVFEIYFLNETHSIKKMTQKRYR